MRTTDNLLILTMIIQQKQQKKQQLTMDLLDITKAYDRVCRETLWNKCNAMGMQLSDFSLDYRKL